MSPTALDVDAILAALVEADTPLDLPLVALGFARAVPGLPEALGPRCARVVDRAVLGLELPPLELGTASAEGVWCLRARRSAGAPVPVEQAAALEGAVAGDLGAWVPAARLHVRLSPERERRARVALSQQALPYVMPGELHPLQVEGLAAADRVVQALHVDWVRKLTELLALALPLDLRAVGGWFWPHLRFLHPGRLKRPLQRAARSRRLAPGGRGLAAAYAARLGLDPLPLLAGGADLDTTVLALALASDRTG